MASLVMDGDSITSDFPNNTVPNEQLYTYMLGQSLGLPVVNRALSNGRAADQSDAARGFTPDPDDIHTVLIGTNDVRVHGISHLDQDIGFIRNLVLKYALPDIVNASEMSEDGSWSGVQVNSEGRKSKTLGNAISTVVSGTAVYVSTIIHDSGTAQGVAEVFIDGVHVGTVDTASNDVETAKGLKYAPAVWRFGNLSPGVHTVTLLIASSGKLFFLEHIAGSDQPSRPAVYVGTVPHQDYAGQGDTDNVTAFNVELAQMVDELAGDGLNVSLVDVAAVVEPLTETIDGLHPDAQGHQDMHDAFLAAISGNDQVADPDEPDDPVEVYDAVTAYVRESDGTFWIGEGDARRQILTA
jgi:hypothetical protein